MNYNLTNNGIIVDASLHALIFDCDGTLVDSMPTHMEAWEYAFKKLNAEYNEDFLFSFKGMKDTDIVDLYNKEYGTSLDGNLILEIKSDYFISNINKITPIKPVVDTARFNYKKLPMAVVSGSPARIVYEELKFIGITNLFDVIITADDPFRPKPDPEIFLATAAKLNTDPALCMVFEDGDAGLEAAVKAGMQTFDVRKLF